VADRSITVIIPPEMSDSDECYRDVVEYVAACTGLGCSRNDLCSEDGVSCDAYFEDGKGSLWHGQLSYPPLPDGSQRYIVVFDKEVVEQEPKPIGHPSRRVRATFGPEERVRSILVAQAASHHNLSRPPGHYITDDFQRYR
jgi:hypothetical protein